MMVSIHPKISHHVSFLEPKHHVFLSGFISSLGEERRLPLSLALLSLTAIDMRQD
jgi:hypothetical protein